MLSPAAVVYIYTNVLLTQYAQYEIYDFILFYFI